MLSLKCAFAIPALSLFALSAFAQDSYKVTCRRDPPDPANPKRVIDRCTIQNPTVTQPFTKYPEIAIGQGDVVDISASGCVQTGGKGKTWKRYVDPSGPNSDRLYHGLIWLRVDPMKQFPVQRFQRGLNSEFQVPLGAHAELWLGYEDDQFDDNGYYKHDPGTENQCSGSDSVSVSIGIVRSGLPVIPGNYPQPADPKSGPQTTLFYLTQQVTSPTDTEPANGAWANTFGVLAHGKVLAIQNQNPFAVEMVVDQHSTAECFKGTAATVVLPPKATTTTAQLNQIFTLGTAFPRPMVACAYAGSTPPQLLAFIVTYLPQ